MSRPRLHPRLRFRPRSHDRRHPRRCASHPRSGRHPPRLGPPWAGALVLALALSLAHAPLYSDLLFSEYVEGSSNQKYLEIANPGPDSADLAGVQVRIHPNGAAEPSNVLELSAVAPHLAAGAVLVLRHPQATLYAGEAHPTAVCNFNGNDALTLHRGDLLLDAFGRPGENPGVAWIQGDRRTNDQTLRRHPGLAAGSARLPEPGFPELAVEWLPAPLDDLADLGRHTFSPGGGGARLILTVDPPEVRESAGPGAAILTLRFEPPLDGPLPVSLDSSPDGEISLPPSVTGPAGAEFLEIPLVPLYDGLPDGDQTVIIRAHAPDYPEASVTLRVRDAANAAALLLEVDPPRILESDGPAAAQLRVGLSLPPAADWTVSLAAAPAGEVLLPGSVILPAGQTSLTVPVAALGDFRADGEQTVVIHATAPGAEPASANLQVGDIDGAPALFLEADRLEWPETAGPDAAYLRLRLTRPAPAGGLLVALSATPAEILDLPATLLCPEGLTRAAVALGLRDDRAGTGDRRTLLTASAPGWAGASLELLVRDVPSRLTARFAPSEWTGPGGAGDLLLTADPPPAADTPWEVALRPEGLVTGPVSGTWPAGTAEFRLPLRAPLQLGRTEPATATAQAWLENYPRASANLGLRPSDPAVEFQLSPAELAETAPPAVLTGVVRIEPPLAEEVVFTLEVDPPETLALPATLTVPAGSGAVGFAGQPLSDGLPGTDREVVVRLRHRGLPLGEAGLLLRDSPNALHLTLAAASIPEDASTPLVAVVAIDHPLARDLPLALTASPADELSLPTHVLLPAGQERVDGAVLPVRDHLADGDVPVLLTVSGDGFPEVSAELLVRDVDPAAPPALEWLAPAAEAVCALGDSIDLEVLARPAAGWIERVAFQRNGEPLGEQIAPPYRCSFTPAAPGLYHLTASARDAAGRESRLPARVLRVTGGAATAPRVRWSEPRDGLVVRRGAPVTLAAEAEAGLFPLRQLSIRADGQVLGSTPGEGCRILLQTAREGDLPLSAEATDQAGQTALAPPRRLRVWEPRPPSAPADFLERVWTDLLGRAPRPDESARWTPPLAESALSRAEVLEALLETPEGREWRDATLLHFLLLGRFPDRPELLPDPVPEPPPTLTERASGWMAGAEFRQRWGRLEEMDDRAFAARLFHARYGTDPTPQQARQGESRLSDPPPAGFGGDRAAFAAALASGQTISAQPLFFEAPATDLPERAALAWLEAALHRVAPAPPAPAPIAADRARWIEGLLAHPRFRERCGQAWMGAEPLAGGWKWCDWLGFFHDHSWPWIWWPPRGWAFPGSEDPADLWLFVPGQGWLWAGSPWPGWLYSATNRVWTPL